MGRCSSFRRKAACLLPPDHMHGCGVTCTSSSPCVRLSAHWQTGALSSRHQPIKRPQARASSGAKRVLPGWVGLGQIYPRRPGAQLRTACLSGCTTQPSAGGRRRALAPSHDSAQHKPAFGVLLKACDASRSHGRTHAAMAAKRLAILSAAAAVGRAGQGDERVGRLAKFGWVGRHMHPALLD